MNSKKTYLAVFIILLLLLAVDLLLGDNAGGSYLIPLIFWSGIAQGLIALLAAIELSEGRWAGKLKGYLEDYHPLLLLFPFMFLIFSRHLSVYPWTSAETGWLAPEPFIVRNFVTMLLPWIASFFLVRSIRRERTGTKVFGAIYILFFVISQSFLAFDVVMTFEYPWINTLFGGYFFVESLYAGITFASIISIFLFMKNRKEFAEVLRDTAKMVMGFALLWVGLFFSQYLVIWYGNLPEEVSFIEKRLEVSSLKYLGLYVLIALFVIPFLTYISKKAKVSPPVAGGVAFIVLSGYYLEKVLFLKPAVILSLPEVAIGSIITGIPFMIILRNQMHTG